MNVQTNILGKTISFDYYLKEFDYEKLLYVYPILSQGWVLRNGTLYSKLKCKKQ